MVSELMPLELGKGSYQTRVPMTNGASNRCVRRRRRRIRRAGLWRSRWGKICFNTRLPLLSIHNCIPAAIIINRWKIVIDLC